MAVVELREEIVRQVIGIKGHRRAGRPRRSTMTAMMTENRKCVAAVAAAFEGHIKPQTQNLEQ